MSEKRKKYDRGFREGAVRIVADTGKPVAQVARHLGVHEGTLGTWVARDREAKDGTRGLSTGDVAELKRLRAENAELRMERDVLKRSVVLWVKEATRSERGARFIADQRTKHRVPHVELRVAGVSLAWFYKWAARAAGPGAAHGLHTLRDRRRDSIDRAVAVAFKKARGVHGSPRLHADLREAAGRSVRRPWPSRCAAKAWSRGGSEAAAG